MKLPPDRTRVDVGEYGSKDFEVSNAVVRRARAAVSALGGELAAADSRQLRGMLLFARQITRAYRRIRFGDAIISDEQVEGMVQDALIQLDDIERGSSVWNLSIELWGCLELAAFRPRARRERNPLKAAASEMKFIQRASGPALLESILALESFIAASLALLLRAETQAACAGASRMVLWPRAKNVR